jgi:hypothetical protein
MNSGIYPLTASAPLYPPRPKGRSFQKQSHIFCMALARFLLQWFTARFSGEKCTMLTLKSSPEQLWHLKFHFT